ncbi:glycosyltransferase family 9 protein [Hymenobacter setariae]|uniref:Glycosyltransferase family 9 protein n=1 Tax=Hymenobacter setariae TaxID=2594794 RepID=A0A558BXK8_9BACT|nr:glycosyltransferase family 9 protein [Hymenobacter setariae]TVT41248.1 glycosyltransferase family 9 protein [Hymenobacter setariae]
MLSSFLTRIRLAYRARRAERLVVALSTSDAKALSTQAPPQQARVLVVRNDSIGDYLLYRPWLRQLSLALRARGQQLTLLANRVWAPLAQTWDGEWCDEIIAVDFGAFAKDLSYRSQLVQKLGEKGFGEVIYPLHVREPTVENFIRFLQAPVRVASEGAHQVSDWLSLLNASYSHLLPSTRDVLFEYDRNREFFENWQQLAADPSALPTTEVPLTLPLSVHEAARQVGATTAPYVVLFPGASARQKRWPPSAFAKLARQLHQYYGARYRLVVAGSAADDKLAQQLIQAAGPAVPLENQCGKTDLPGLAALLAAAQLVISNDTVAAHLAVQAGTPCLVLLMGENYGKFFPYPPALLRAPCQCLFPPSQEARFARGEFSPPPRDPIIDKIPVERVLLAAQQMLQ